MGRSVLRIFTLFLIQFILFILPIFCQETLTITTYYPVPFGIYQRLVTMTLGVGDNNASGALTQDDAPNPTVGAQQGDVWIAGDLGIGVTGVRNRLDVRGAATVGAHYAGVQVAPLNGLLVEGNIGIGTPAPRANLEVNNVLMLSPSTNATSAVNGNIFYNTNANHLQYYDQSGNWRNLGGLRVNNAAKYVKQGVAIDPRPNPPTLEPDVNCNAGDVAVGIRVTCRNQCPHDCGFLAGRIYQVDLWCAPLQ